MIRVLFKERYGAWWPGADPVISAELAAELMRRELCIPYPVIAVEQPPSIPVPDVATDANDNDSEDRRPSDQSTGSQVAPKNRQRRPRR